MRCATHPDVETLLTCNKCGKPICPRCLIQTPVGARCRKCAGLTRLPTFQVSPVDYVKAASAGLGIAVVCGILWYLMRLVIPYMIFFNFLVAAAVGYGIGEVISLSVNRKRGPFLKIIAGLCLLIGFTIGNQVTFLGQFIVTFNFFSLIAIAVGVYVATSRL